MNRQLILCLIFLFPYSFYKATIKVAATSYKPFWVETRTVTPAGLEAIHRSGMDYFLLEAVSRAMNFSFDVVPIVYWSEVRLKKGTPTTLRNYINNKIQTNCLT